MVHCEGEVEVAGSVLETVPGEEPLLDSCPGKSEEKTIVSICPELTSQQQADVQLLVDRFADVFSYFPGNTNLPFRRRRLLRRNFSAM